MKTTSNLGILSAVLVILASPGFAADKKKKKAPVPPVVDTAAVALLKPYDKDGNYEISKDELKAVQAAYKADPSGPLKTFDLSHTGTFDDVDRLGMNGKLGAAKMVEAPKNK